MGVRLSDIKTNRARLFCWWVLILQPFEVAKPHSTVHEAYRIPLLVLLAPKAKRMLLQMQGRNLIKHPSAKLDNLPGTWRVQEPKCLCSVQLCSWGKRAVNGEKPLAPSGMGPNRDQEGPS